MAQNSNREYWQQLINKYSERTSELQQKEQELMIRTEALQKLISRSPPTESPCPCPPERPGLFQCIMKSIFPEKKKTPEAAPMPAPPPVSAPVPPPIPIPAPLPVVPPPPPPIITKVPSATTSIPSATTSVPSATTSPPAATANGCSTINDCVCVPPMAKLSESSSCICSIKSENSSSNKSKETNNSAIQRLQEYKVETNNNNFNNRNNFMNYNNNTDVISLKSEDLSMIQKLEGLLLEHKRVNKQVTELEQKERVYKECLGNGSQINGGLNFQAMCNCRCANNNESKDSSEKDSSGNKQELCELKLENLLLKNELKDLKVEIHQHLEKIEGPMQFKVETERYKCLKLEEQLEQQKKEFYEQQMTYKSQISSLNMELMTATTNLYEMSKTNEQLLSMKQQFEFRIKQLEDDLIRQKLSDFETIKSLTEALENCNQAPIPEKKESCNLNEIARELSRTLKELGPCGECSRLPSDIKVTAEYIKELAMLIESKLPKPLPPPPSEAIQEIVETPSLPPPPESTPSMDEAEESPTTPEEVVVEETTISEDASTPAAEQTGGEDDDIVVVMPQTDMQSQSSKSINQVETADDIKLPTPPSHSPIIIDEGPTTAKKCQCGRTKPQPPPAPPQEDRKQATKRKCQCSRKRAEQPPTIAEEETVKPEEVVEPSAPPEEVVETTETPPPPPDDVEQAEEPPTTLKKPCKCAAMKQLMGELTGEQPATEEPAAEEPAAEEPAGEEAPSEEPAVGPPEDRVVQAEKQTEILEEPPGNVHVVTVLTRSGMLDVMTTGPEGRVQTTLRYNSSGNIEVITEIMSTHNNLPPIAQNIESVHSNEPLTNEELVQQEIIETEEAIEEVQEGEENNETQ